MDEVTAICIEIKRIANIAATEGLLRIDPYDKHKWFDNTFTAADLNLGFTPSNQQVVGSAFRLLRKTAKNPRGIIDQVKAVRSKGEGRNSSLVWSWKLV